MQRRGVWIHLETRQTGYHQRQTNHGVTFKYVYVKCCSRSTCLHRGVIVGTVNRTSGGADAYHAVDGRRAEAELLHEGHDAAQVFGGQRRGRGSALPCLLLGYHGVVVWGSCGKDKGTNCERTLTHRHTHNNKITKLVRPQY